MSDSENRLENEISKYVSNLNGDIYTVSNIPEEVIAVIFAYVSRSPKGFRENIGTVIQEEQLGQERASKFHEKWVLNYGHASVAEHASIHVGIENVSRLFHRSWSFPMNIFLSPNIPRDTRDRREEISTFPSNLNPTLICPANSKMYVTDSMTYIRN